MAVKRKKWQVLPGEVTESEAHALACRNTTNAVNCKIESLVLYVYSCDAHAKRFVGVDTGLTSSTVLQE